MQDRDMVLIFLFILIKKDRTTDNIMNFFQAFGGSMSICSETRMIWVACTASFLCAVGRGTSAWAAVVLYQWFPTRDDFAPRAHLAISGVIFSCHNLCDDLLLASSVYRPRMLPPALQCETGSP